MALLYFAVFLLFFALLVAGTVYPFFRLTHKLRTDHPGLWSGFGPFDLKTLSESAQARKNLVRFMSSCQRDEALAQKDPELIKAAKVALEVYKFTGESLKRQVMLCILYLLVAGALANAAMHALFT